VSDQDDIPDGESGESDEPMDSRYLSSTGDSLVKGVSRNHPSPRLLLGLFHVLRAELQNSAPLAVVCDPASQRYHSVDGASGVVMPTRAYETEEAAADAWRDMAALAIADSMAHVVENLQASQRTGSPAPGSAFNSMERVGPPGVEYVLCDVVCNRCGTTFLSMVPTNILAQHAHVQCARCSSMGADPISAGHSALDPGDDGSFIPEDAYGPPAPPMPSDSQGLVGGSPDDADDDGGDDEDDEDDGDVSAPF